MSSATEAAALPDITDKMIAEKDGAIGWMIFNNPARHNAISVEMWEAMPKILDEFEADPDVRVIVLKGAGEKAFVSGADISQFEQQRSSPELVKHYEDLADTAGYRLATCPKPTIAMVRGYCIGGGLGIALGCDLRIATEGSQFGVPAAKLGLGYRAGGIKKLLELVGPSFAKEIFFTARRFSAAEAIEMGLINRSLPDGELDAYVRGYCDTIAANAPMTIHASKKIIEELLKSRADLDAEKCERLVMDCFNSEDYVEGRRAFMEKRKPVFKGR